MLCVVRDPILIHLWVGTLDQQKNLTMLKNLWRKGGHTPTRIFSNPCPSSRIVTKDEFAYQEEVET